MIADMASRPPPPLWNDGMNATDGRVPAGLVWALGITQTIGYGTLYYSFGPLAPRLAQAFGWPESALFGLLAGSLLLGGAVAPWAGSLADRLGGGRVMAVGSIAASLALVFCAMAGNGMVYALGLLSVELASTLVLYPLAFATLAQLSGGAAQRQIVHVTLIAGFASSVFWPVTTWLVGPLGWQGTYLVFAALNLLVCAPIHLGLARHAVRSRRSGLAAPVLDGHATGANAPLLLGLMLAGFALAGIVATAIAMHMVPMLDGLGLGGASVAIAMLFGPAQVASRVVNMGFGARLPQPVLAMLAAGLMPLGLLVLVVSAPSSLGAVGFALLFGFGSGLFSIVGGTLPLMLFGNRGYGRRLGVVTAARQFAAALAPFIFALLTAGLGSRPALVAVSLCGAAATLAFAAIAWQTRGPAAPDPAAAARQTG